MRQNVIFCMVLLCIYCTSITAQCFTDRHNTNNSSAWLSCSTSENPNPERGTSHWIMYELDDVYNLYDLTIWNYNNISNSDQGLQEIIIDISLDGIEWTHAQEHALSLATNSSFYEGEKIGTLQGRQAKYILITALTNFGGSCFGFSEIKMDLEPTTTLPIGLLEFSLNPNASDAILTWETESEIDINKYEILRREDNDKWTYIGDLKSNSANSQRNTYTYKDPDILKRSQAEELYYKLKIVENNGLITYSDVRSIKPSREILFNVYPNPSSGELLVSFDSKSTESIQIEVVNSLGQVSLKESRTLSGGFEKLSLDLRKLPNANYLIKFSSQEKQIYQTIISLIQ